MIIHLDESGNIQRKASIWKQNSEHCHSRAILILDSQSAAPAFFLLGGSQRSISIPSTRYPRAQVRAVWDENWCPCVCPSVRQSVRPPGEVACGRANRRVSRRAKHGVVRKNKTTRKKRERRGGRIESRLGAKFFFLVQR